MRKLIREIKGMIRKQRLKIGRKILDKNKKKVKMDTSEIKNIIVMRQDGKIGDTIVGSFVYREIKKENPNIKIDVVCMEGNKRFFELNKNIDNIFILKKKSYFQMTKLGFKLRKKNYDVLAEMSGDLRNKHLYFLNIINAKINLSYSKEHYKIFNLNTPDEKEHMYMRYLKTFRLLGFKIENREYDIPEDLEIDNKIKSFFNKNKLDNVITVNFFGSSRNRRINFENSINLLNYILENYKDDNIFIVYSPNKKKIIDQIIDSIENKSRIFYLENQTSIFETIAILKRSKLLITPDTGLVHLAHGLKLKQIAFFSDNENNYIDWVHPESDIITYRYLENINTFDFKTFENSYKGLKN